jgi:hypothetical protein
MANLYTMTNEEALERLLNTPLAPRSNMTVSHRLVDGCMLGCCPGDYLESDEPLPRTNPDSTTDNH